MSSSSSSSTSSSSFASCSSSPDDSNDHNGGTSSFPCTDRFETALEAAPFDSVEDKKEDDDDDDSSFSSPDDDDDDDDGGGPHLRKLSDVDGDDDDDGPDDAFELEVDPPPDADADDNDNDNDDAPPRLPDRIEVRWPVLQRQRRRRDRSASDGNNNDANAAVASGGGVPTSRWYQADVRLPSDDSSSDDDDDDSDDDDDTRPIDRRGAKLPRVLLTYDERPSKNYGSGGMYGDDDSEGEEREVAFVVPRRGRRGRKGKEKLLLYDLEEYDGGQVPLVYRVVKRNRRSVGDSGNDDDDDGAPKGAATTTSGGSSDEATEEEEGGGLESYDERMARLARCAGYEEGARSFEDAAEAKARSKWHWFNDENAPVFHGLPSSTDNESNDDDDEYTGGDTSYVEHCRFYCGRSLPLNQTPPDSDGNCGPNNGPPCASCVRFYDNHRLDVLRKRFPTLGGPSLVAALRCNGGVYGETVRWIRRLGGVYETDPFVALTNDDEKGEEESKQPAAASGRSKNGARCSRKKNRRSNRRSKDQEEEDDNDDDQREELIELRDRYGEFESLMVPASSGADENSDDAGDYKMTSWGKANAKGDDEEEGDIKDNDGVCATSATVPIKKAAFSSKGSRSKLCAAVAITSIEPSPEDFENNPLPSARMSEEKKQKAGAAQEAECQVKENVAPSAEGGKSTETSFAPTIVLDGHKLLLRPDSSDGREFRCLLCSVAIPSEQGGRYQCQACSLCEGCVRTRTVVDCPRLANGGSFHRHPLCMVPNRQSECCCDVEGDHCQDFVTWSCTECDFDLCAVCAGRPVPDGWDRRLRFVDVNESGGSGDDDEGAGSADIIEDNESDAIDGNDDDEGWEDERRSQFEDANAVERMAASRWEGAMVQHLSSQAEVVVGTMVVGTTPPPLAPRLSGRRRRRGGQGGTVSAAGGNVRLSAEATDALEQFRARNLAKKTNSSTSNGEDSTIAAADLTHVENILERAEAVDHRLTRRALCDAIAAGRLGIAGTLLLSQTFAPTPPHVDDDRDATISAREGVETSEKHCWCGDAIVAETSPDGAVGCLGGHAMHASCAADLLLGGGLCPTCRQPLFFSRIAEKEAKAAAEAAKEEILRAQREEEEKTRLEFEEQAAKGVKISLSVGDVVRIASDKNTCRHTQARDPVSGGWNEDMVDCLNMEGYVTETIKEDDDVIAAQVRCIYQNPQHVYKRIYRPGKGPSYTCPACDCEGPSTETGKKRCLACLQCEKCCNSPGNRTCSVTHEWTWHISLLSILRRSCGAAPWLDDAAKTAENHLARLRAELSAVKAAREAVKDEMEKVKGTELASATEEGTSACDLHLHTSHRKRELSANSSEAVVDVSSSVSAADWQRARHVMLLARQWGDSQVAREKRSALYKLVRAGELDSVARQVRRHNAAKMADSMRWKDAMSETSEYMVVPSARVDLRAFPSATAPKTGYVLHPGAQFTSKKEWLDSCGSFWLQVAEPPSKATQKKAGVTSNIQNPDTLIGKRVERGDGWHYDDQDGGEGNHGVIRALCGNRVFVQWEANGSVEYYYLQTKAPFTLQFTDESPPPPQGWLCVRPGGLESPAVVTKARSALRCFGCGDSLIPPIVGSEKYYTAEGCDVSKGDRLFVAATLEPVEVKKVSSNSRILCSFPEDSALAEEMFDGWDGEDINEISAVWYSKRDLVFPSKKKVDAGELGEGDESRCVLGQMQTRRELVIMFNGDERRARKVWNEAVPCPGSETDSGIDGTSDSLARTDASNFASCLRGHLLHARCFQGVLLEGRSCPAPGCTEHLWVPRVKRNNNEDVSCGASSDGAVAENEALRVASELSGHAAAVSARAGAEGSPGGDSLEITTLGDRELKMCPACCAGPLFNENCSDMQTHHGECTAALLGHAVDRCTEDGRFRATEAEMAERLLQITPDKSVADVLPRCPTHNTLVMFNGCMACGVTFSDIRWHDMPAWDPHAKELLELDVKKRRAARLLAEQVRREAALLEFERNTLWNAKHHKEGYDDNIEPPAPPAPHGPFVDDDEDDY